MPVERRSCTCIRYIPRLWPGRLGCSVYTNGRVINGPPSSGQHVKAGKSSRFTSLVITSVTGPRVFGTVPMRSKEPATSLASHNLEAVGGNSVSARPTSRLISCSGRVPNANSARRDVPNKFVTSGNDALVTFVNNSAGPPAAITRR